MGASTARMVANAPVYGDRFSWHVDADPSSFPPSPWRDHFGTYTNRSDRVPSFMSLLFCFFFFCEILVSLQLSRWMCLLVVHTYVGARYYLGLGRNFFFCWNA